MSKGQQDAGFRHVRMLFNIGSVGDLTDGRLLERYTARDGETAEMAFSTLVERHGPMVLRVCRSVLRDPHDAHDAFQATFLVLARRADSLWVRGSLGPWLYQVAYRVASCARSAANRRRRHEQRAAELAGPGGREEDRDDLGDVLHVEVNRLPWGCREAVVLCYFEGLSPEQAARQLGCPVGTVQSRLARGRERLRSRLKRRGLAPEIGAMGTGFAMEAPPPAPPTALVEAVIRAATPLSSTAAASGSVVGLTEGVLKAMFLIKLRTVAELILTTAALAAGAQSLLQEAPAPRPQANLEQIRAELGEQGASDPGRRQPPPETGPPPQDLTWTDVAPDEKLRVIEQLAAQSRGNYEKIKTWKGIYSYVLKQYLNDQFVAQLIAGAQLSAGRTAPQGKPEGLMQEFDSALTFAIDVGTDAIYRDVETSRMRFLKLGTDEEVKIQNVAPADHRSIVTPNSYLFFHPKERATTVFLPDHPDAQMKRRVERFPAREAQVREGGSVDPRAFFKFDPGNSFWTGFELYARAFRGELGAEQKNVVEQRLKISKADGPGGTWYRNQMGFTGGSGPMRWVTRVWSPQAGYNPVSSVSTLDKPDGKIQFRIDWQWKLIDGVYLPSTIKESDYRGPDGRSSREQLTKLKECVLNQPLAPHQFDEGGLGLNDGDLILNHLERIAYIIRDGKSVKLADFGDRSVLRPAPAKPAPASAPASAPHAQSVGRIYTTASLGTDADGRPVFSVVAVDPEIGEVTKIADESPGRLRVSPDGLNLAYVSGEWSRTLPPAERMRQSLWTRAIAGGAAPKQLVGLDGVNPSGLPVWSPDGKQIILSVGTLDESSKKWVNETFRINADGSGREPLKIPTEDGVQDWSPDGAWVVTTSNRNAKIGWQLYVMNPDGGNQRQVTEGGNPFYARFSPDGGRLLYSDGPAKERRGVWVVGLDGKDRRRIFSTDVGVASACWSPDGRRIAVAISGSKPEERGRIEIVDLDGAHRTLLTLPSQEIADMPDWR
ncbi:MAG: sigma-70 family RNA polymerase sigma factor [Paludisphaera borealis]|uniref:sigma-70 family RNA polymerase sigma factor n=1 Tax=Paludisphaera borealis TaxID=1387353 RepID=UPI00283FE876|nr:sigma-70 family RNA polymerase sigma factor [Paludisphaera borealis]MDR3618041.1 sigma-70 family RNA polymerase sigma factor [Paludisphaera borealis]